MKQILPLNFLRRANVEMGLEIQFCSSVTISDVASYFMHNLDQRQKHCYMIVI